MIDDNQRDGNRPIYGIVYLYYHVPVHVRVDLLCLFSALSYRQASGPRRQLVTQQRSRHEAQRRVGRSGHGLPCHCRCRWASREGMLLSEPFTPSALSLCVLVVAFRTSLDIRSFRLTFTRCTISLPPYATIAQSYPKHAT